MSSASSTHMIRRKKNVKKVVPFTMMVCGTSGTGRTTFVNTLCGEPLLEPSEPFDPRSAHLERPVNVKPAYTEIEEEDGTRIGLTVVDTPGFGDNINNEEAFGKIVKYLETQYDEVLAEESRIRRNPRTKDNRVHCCLYFIEPTGHGLRELDVELMKRLGKKVNIIPCIGRSDQLTQLELSTCKKMVMDDINHYQIPIYNFPYDAEEDDTETIEENQYLRNMMPFAIVSGTEIVEIGGQETLVRRYPWGVVQVEDERHSDFVPLRSALLGSHLGDLKDLTHDLLYESYRTEKLSSSVEGENPRDSRLLNPEDLANQSYILKEQQLAREEEKLRDIEMRVQKEINDKRMELSAREAELREIEARISRERSEANTPQMPSSPLPSVPPPRRPSHASYMSDSKESSENNNNSAGSPMAQVTNSLEQASLSPTNSRFSNDTAGSNGTARQNGSDRRTSGSMKQEEY